jgi:hypothetical protein
MKIAGFEVWNYQAGEPVKSPTDTYQMAAHQYQQVT